MPAPVGASLTAFLNLARVTPLEVHEQVDTVVAETLAELGLEAEFISCRYGEVLLKADPTNAALLRFDSRKVLDAVTERTATEARRLKVATR